MKTALTFFKKYILTIIASLLLVWFIVLMLRIIMLYIPIQTDVAFLTIKQQYINVKHWFTAFYIHVYTGIFVLLAGFTQFSPYILRQYKKVHIVAGRIYAFNIIFITGPTAFIMSFYSSGGSSGVAAFVILSILWWCSTLYGVILAKNGKIIQHKSYMMRSYALALSAITLRFLKVIIATTTNLSVHERYQIIAWGGWLINLFIVELIIYYQHKRFVF